MLNGLNSGVGDTESRISELVYKSVEFAQREQQEIG